MLQVKTPEEVKDLIQKEFHPLKRPSEPASLADACGRILADDIVGKEYVPDFNRSTVDGFAVRSRDTFGCSESIPAILTLTEKILMGEKPKKALLPDCCASVPTGGALPEGADCVIMQEYTEDYQDGTIGMFRPGAPGENIIYRGDDVHPGKILLKKGKRLSSRDIGVLASLGITEVPVVPKLKIGILSTGDELVPPDTTPSLGQIRDVNSSMLTALFSEYGALCKNYGIVKDEEDLLLRTVRQALSECDAVIISGGSSAGEKDACAGCIETLGDLLLHGIAIKPGKPTLIGRSNEKPLIGLPGHPGAAWFIAKEFVHPLLDRLTGRERIVYPVRARLTENIGANHGRAYLCACTLEQSGNEWRAHPVRSKSGLITALSGTDGYIYVSRDCEGFAKDTEISVYIYEDQ